MNPRDKDDNDDNTDHPFVPYVYTPPGPNDPDWDGSWPAYTPAYQTYE